jgi:DNA polymerase delta subunit 1
LAHSIHMVVFQALTWEARDVEGEHHISVFGKTEEGKSVCVTTTFDPYFFVKLPRDTKPADVTRLFNDINLLKKDHVTSYSLTKQKDVWGFQNNEEFHYMHLNFKTLEARRKVNSIFMYNREFSKYHVYESNIDPVLRLMHRTGIQSTGWINTGANCVRSHLAKTDIDLWCNDWSTLTPVARDDIAPFIVASFDIECNSSTGKFPDADVTNDACFQIAISLCKFGSDEPYDKTCLCYKKTDPKIEGSNVISFDTEKELLLAFKRYTNENDIDILTGWNIFGFDLDYIYKRAAMVGCGLEFYDLGKLKESECHIVYKKLSSSALGDNFLKLLPMPGRFIFDMFHEVKKGYKLDSYSLNNVSKLYLGDQKIWWTTCKIGYKCFSIKCSNQCCYRNNYGSSGFCKWCDCKLCIKTDCVVWSS